MQPRLLPRIEIFEVIVELMVARSVDERKVIDGGHSGHLSDLLFNLDVFSNTSFFESRKVTNDQGEDV